MNGIEKINARLKADAQAEVDAIRAETEARCAEIAAEYAAKAQEAYEQRMSRGRADCAAGLERAKAGADMEQRKALLQFKQEMVSAAFEKAVEAILSLPREEYTAYLSYLAAEACTLGTEEIALSAADRETIGPELLKKTGALLKARGISPRLHLSSHTAPIRGGLVVRQGNIEINCAVETLVKLHRSGLASQVADILFS